MDNRLEQASLGVPGLLNKLPSAISISAISSRSPMQARSPSLKRATRTFRIKSKSTHFLNTVMKQIFMKRLSKNITGRLHKIRRQAGSGSLKYLSPLQIKIVNDKSCGGYTNQMEEISQYTRQDDSKNKFKIGIRRILTNVDSKFKKIISIVAQKTPCNKILIQILAKAKILIPELPVLRPNGYINFFSDFLNFLCGIIMILFVSLSFCFQIPVNNILTFQNRSLEEKTNIFLHLFFIVGLLSSLMEISIGFTTAYYTNGELILSKKKARANYIKSSLLLDVLTLYPFISSFFSFAANSEWTARADSLLIILKLRNIIKFIKKIEELISLHEHAEAWFSLIKLFATVLLISHWIACFWCLIPVLNPNERSWTKTLSMDFSSTPWPKIYLKALYWALTTVVTLGYGDITPQNDIETIFSMFVMLSGSAIVGYSINKIGLVLENLNRRHRNMIKNLKLVSRYLKSKGLSLDLQTRVCKFIENSFEEEMRPSIQAEQILAARLNQTLTNELNGESYTSLLEGIAVFKNNFSCETLKKLTNSVRLAHFRPGEIITKVHQPEKDSLFIVSEGYLSLDLTAGRRVSQSLFLKKGDHFGEYSLFTGMPQELTVRSLHYSTLIELKREDFLKIMQEKQNEYEKFCEIKDRVLSNQLKVLSEECKSCGENTHQIHKCPYVNLLPPRHLVILKYQYSPFQKRYRKFNRKRKKNGFHALLSYKLISESCKEIRMSDVFIDFYGQESSIFTNNQEDDEDDENSFRSMEILKSGRKEGCEAMEELADEDTNLKCLIPRTDSEAMIRINPNNVLPDESLMTRPIPVQVAQMIANPPETLSQAGNNGQTSSFIVSKGFAMDQRRFSFENMSNSRIKNDISQINKPSSSRCDMIEKNLSNNGSVQSFEKKHKPRFPPTTKFEKPFGQEGIKPIGEIICDKDHQATPREKEEERPILAAGNEEMVLMMNLFWTDMDVMLINGSNNYFPEFAFEQVMSKFQRGPKSPTRKRKEYTVIPSKN